MSTRHILQVKKIYPLKMVQRQSSVDIETDCSQDLQHDNQTPSADFSQIIHIHLSVLRNEMHTITLD